jgi:endonuclease YncB( thermonuclease family)
VPQSLPTRSRSAFSVPTALLVVVAVAIVGFTATFLDWQGAKHEAARLVGTPDVQIIRPSRSSIAIDVVDGDTVRSGGAVYRLVGFDTPERGDRARCDDERRRAEVAKERLRALLGSGEPKLQRVACACMPGTEGTNACNFGRLCASLSVGGRDVGNILISEGLARPFVCGGTSCPMRRPWC